MWAVGWIAGVKGAVAAPRAIHGAGATVFIPSVVTSIPLLPCSG